MAMVDVDLSQFDDDDLLEEVKYRRLGELKGSDVGHLVIALLTESAYRDEFLEELDRRRCPDGLREEFEAWLRNSVGYDLGIALRAGRYAPQGVR